MTEQSSKPVATKAELTISKGWVQGVALVMVFGFLVMGMLAVPDLHGLDAAAGAGHRPGRRGGLHRQDVTAGQQIFLRRGLQQYGSVMGHGGYLGPDYTAEYLRFSADHVGQHCATPGGRTRLPPRRDAADNRYDEASGDAAVHRRAGRGVREATRSLRRLLRHRHHQVRPDPTVITDPQEIHELTAFFSWTAWAGAAERPATTTPTPTTGRPSRGSTTPRPPTSWCGPACR